jgi:hypothetical protein
VNSLATWFNPQVRNWQVALLFEDSEDRFNHRLTPCIGCLSGRTSQLGPHPAMRRIVGPGAATCAQVQSPGHVRIRDVDIDVALFHSAEVVDGKESAVGQRRTRRPAAALFDQVHNGFQGSLSVTFWVTHWATMR